MKSFSEIHQCSNSENKIILLYLDKSGLTKCGYCNKVIDMRPLLEDPEYKRKIQELLGEQ